MIKIPSSQLPVPPLDLVHRAGHMGDTDPQGEYLRFGMNLRAQLEATLPTGWSWRGRRVLDFGCGTGKVLSHFVDEATEAEFWGCDIDGPSIEWVQHNLCPPFRAFVCRDEADLPQPDGYFDLIFAWSVYTHITDRWAEWLLEHHRVLAEDGLLFASFLGEGMVEELTSEEWCEDRIGMNILNEGNPWDCGGPTVLHPLGGSELIGDGRSRSWNSGRTPCQRQGNQQPEVHRRQPMG